ncbi:KEOPS complex Pcc1-like subunit [Salinarchaeum sp. Harcht-Bsk1]|uniref:KEOPS complex subunit Pcc1 n=1 Tax=Salinarchaeum sp. Harcht-Bsk1 TaxID=1333523 RepID=UPI000342369B|nr:KEOPS complex subunit Pcc1 [Salinarchaeum sp. Harcht-Bsk1]AGN00536.1 KEOPS complex Pcc1-like subunit [Salinarchaeum sp. Harcht-Bsk1]
MAIRATLEFSYADSALAQSIERAISLDAGAIEGDRSATAVTRDDDTVIVEIDAADPKALRAAKRTWCSHVAAAEETAIAAR